MMKLRTRLFAGLLVLAAICCTACSAPGASMMDSAANIAPGAPDEYVGYDKDYVYTESESAKPSAPSASGAEVPTTESSADPLADRKIVRTLRITAETKAFDDAIAVIEQTALSLGGYIEASSRSGGSLRDSGSVIARRASYTLRIPADRLEDFRASMGGAVNITDESSNVDDITDQYYDVEARLSSLKLQEERLLAMLAEAKELEYMITLERRLADVRYEIETYTGTIRRYDNRVAYSTVNLTLSEVLEYTPVTPAPKTFGERIGVAFRDSWTDFAEGCKNFTIWLIYALPTLLTVGVVAAVVIGAILLLVKKANRPPRA